MTHVEQLGEVRPALGESRLGLDRPAQARDGLIGSIEVEERERELVVRGREIRPQRQGPAQPRDRVGRTAEHARAVTGPAQAEPFVRIEREHALVAVERLLHPSHALVEVGKVRARLEEIGAVLDDAAVARDRIVGPIERGLAQPRHEVQLRVHAIDAQRRLEVRQRLGVAVLHERREPEEIMPAGVARLVREHLVRARLALGEAARLHQRVPLDDQALQGFGEAHRSLLRRKRSGSSSASTMSSQPSAASSTMSSTRSKPSAPP
jgi:hypothetical protein